MTFLEARRADLRQLLTAKTEAATAGRADFAAIYQAGVDALSRQLAEYTADKGEAHFVNEDGFTAANMAFGTVGEIELQEAVEQEIVDTFDRGTITAKNIFGGILSELQEDGEGAFVQVRGYKIALDGDRLTMTAEDGESRSFPTDNLITE